MRTPYGTFTAEPLESADTLRCSYLANDRWIVEVEYLIAAGLQQFRENKQRTDSREYYGAALLVLDAHRRICTWLQTDEARKEPSLVQRLSGKRDERKAHVDDLFQMTMGILHTYGFLDAVGLARATDAPVFATLTLATNAPFDWIVGLPPDVWQEIEDRHNAFRDSYEIVVSTGATERFDVVEVVDISPHGNFPQVAPAGSYAFAVSSRSRLVVVNTDGKPVSTSMARALLDWAREDNLLTQRRRLGTARPEGVLAD